MSTRPTGDGVSTTRGLPRLAAIFRFRAACMTIFALSLVCLPIFDDVRFVVAGFLVVVIVPFNLLAERASLRRNGVPLAVAYCDQFFGIAATAAFPELWAPIFLVGISSLALAASSQSERDVRRVLVCSMLSAGVIAYLALEPALATIATIGFAGSAALAVIPTALLVERQADLVRENRELVENVDAVVWVLDEDEERLVSLSAAASRILGHPVALLESVAFWMDHVVDEDRLRVQAARLHALRTGERNEVDYRFRRASGEVVWVSERITADVTPEGVVRARGVTVDISARREAEQERALYGELVESLQTALLVARPDDSGDIRIVAANPAAEEIFGLAGADLVDARIATMLAPVDDDIHDRVCRTSRDGEGFVVHEVSALGIDRRRTHNVRVFALPGRTVGIALEDVTEEVKVAAALKQQALHDGLTGLPNRSLLRERLRYALADAKRRSERVALVLLDLNHFKEVNDALGHQYGDLLLTAFARRLQDLLRECDTIARLGGDEFALLLTHATNDGASRVVTKVTEAMQEPFEIDGVTVQATASLGVALYPDHAEDADLLTQRADVAMYNAKRGGGGWAIYSPSQDKSSLERLTLLSELHHELEGPHARSLMLHYQPVFDLSIDRIVGSEALLRWPHPEFGWLNPELVVELAELSGLVGPLATFVTMKAVASAARWAAEGTPIQVAVNLSARNLYDRNLVENIEKTLAAASLSPTMLKCELTESQVMDDPVVAMEVIGKLKDIGVSTAIDDFGTGYSSLAYLRRLSVDEIKIDKSFVMTMLADENDMMIVRTIVDLGHNLGMSVLAEGVEDAATLETLRSFGCDRIQGYLIGKPMPATELAAMLTSRPAAVTGP